MRHLLIAASIGLFIGPLSAGESFPKVVKLPEQAEVRGAPSKDAVATGRLARGDEVLVLRADANHPDWFEIRPPKDSFSWIQADHVKKVDAKNGFVDAAPDRMVKIFAGSALEIREPNAIVAEVSVGTIVLIVERPLTVQGKTWYPIAPMRQEVRYLHKSQLGFAPAENKTTTTPSTADEITALRQRVEALEKRVEQLEKRKKRRQP